MQIKITIDSQYLPCVINCHIKTVSKTIHRVYNIPICAVCLHSSLDLNCHPSMKDYMSFYNFLKSFNGSYYWIKDTSEVELYLKSNCNPPITSVVLDFPIKTPTNFIRLKASNLRVINFKIKDSTVEFLLENKTRGEISIADWDKSTKVTDE